MSEIMSYLPVLELPKKILISLILENTKIKIKKLSTALTKIRSFF